MIVCVAIINFHGWKMRKGKKHELLTLAYVDRTCRRCQDERKEFEAEDTYGPAYERNPEILWIAMDA